jgi:hypothetical protein
VNVPVWVGRPRGGQTLAGVSRPVALQSCEARDVKAGLAKASIVKALIGFPGRRVVTGGSGGGFPAGGA